MRALRAAIQAPGRLLRLLYPLGRWLFGALACLTLASAILPLGWAMADMRARIARRGAAAAPWRGTPPLWARAPAAATFRDASLRNLSDGLAALLTLCAGTAPFTLLWLLGWWGGWENSFSKGYEQAWVGPTMSLLGVAIAPPLLARLPMALAHQAAERRMSAFFERRRVGRLIALAGWSYVGLALLTVLAALPLLAAKGLPAFIEKLRPDLAEAGPEEIEAFRFAWRFWTAVYLIGAFILLKRLSARIYVRARLRLEAGERPGRGGALRWPGLWLVQSLLVAQIYVGQFLNHDWAFWLVPPLASLPWAPLGGTF